MGLDGIEGEEERKQEGERVVGEWGMGARRKERTWEEGKGEEWKKKRRKGG